MRTLLGNMYRPAGHTAHREQGHKQVGRKAVQVVDDPSVEVDVHGRASSCIGFHGLRDGLENRVGRLEIPGTVNGVVISRVDPTGAGFQALLRRGFVIMEINKRPVATVAEYQRVVAAARPGDILVFYVYDPTLAQRSLVTVTVE